MAKKIQNKLNHNKPSFFDSYSVKKFRMVKNPLKIHFIEERDTQGPGYLFMADLHIEYNGLISVEVETTMRFNLTLVECNK